MTKKKTTKRNPMTGDLKRLKSAIESTAKSARKQAKRSIKTSYDQAKDEAYHLQDNVEDFVAHKPGQAIGIALLSGAILGFAMRHKWARRGRRS